MDDLKGKKVKDLKKINNSSIKLRKKVRKRTRKKQKGKENFRTSTGISLFSQIFKPGINKRFGRLRVKSSQGIEGMFFKGLRSEYITRKTLSEANEARKNEDINKIIDIGKVFLQRKEPLERPLKRLHDSETDYGGPEKPRGISSCTSENLEQCPLSPISGVTSPFDEEKIKQSPGIRRRIKIDFEKEFKKFSQEYEESVGTHVLRGLTENGVLEYALNSLRKARKFEQTDLDNVSEEFKGDETQLSKEFKFSTQDFEMEEPAAEDFIKDFIFSKNLSVPKTDYYCESFTKKSLLVRGDELEDYYHLSLQPICCNGEENKNPYGFDSKMFLQRNPGNSAKILSITTPPMQFYRRNMF